MNDSSGRFLGARIRVVTTAFLRRPRGQLAGSPLVLTGFGAPLLGGVGMSFDAGKIVGNWIMCRPHRFVSGCLLSPCCSRTNTLARHSSSSLLMVPIPPALTVVRAGLVWTAEPYALVLGLPGHVQGAPVAEVDRVELAAPRPVVLSDLHQRYRPLSPPGGVGRSASRNMPTSTARRVRSSSQSIRSSAKLRLSG